MGRLGRLGLEPAVRYERERPGELIHIDIKKLGRIARPGWRVWGRMQPVPKNAATRIGETTSAGSTCTSRSMTAPVLPTPRS